MIFNEDGYRELTKKILKAKIYEYIGPVIILPLLLCLAYYMLSNANNLNDILNYGLVLLFPLSIVLLMVIAYFCFAIGLYKNCSKLFNIKIVPLIKKSVDEVDLGGGVIRSYICVYEINGTEYPAKFKVYEEKIKSYYSVLIEGGNPFYTFNLVNYERDPLADEDVCVVVFPGYPKEYYLANSYCLERIYLYVKSKRNRRSR